MESAFSVVVFGAVALSIVMSLVFLLGQGNVYDQIGEGSLTGSNANGEADPGDTTPETMPLPGSQELQLPADTALLGPSARERHERELEIRQMVAARSERRVRRGEPPLDVDAEVARLTAVQPTSSPQRDEQLLQEVLQLVVARNERRERQGLHPLDIEAEVARTLAELGA
ncbi:MAG TPA: hypothetical protein VMG62_02140 [Solirubrobacteraceae bacterium]|nr:hypothetical protein [Solirubrobacteraceae bacterium]